MHDEEGLANGQGQAEQESTTPATAATSAVAVEIAVVDEDAMDTTPDIDQQLVLPNGSAGQSHTFTAQLQSTATNDVARDDADSSVQTDSAGSADDAVSDNHSKLQSVTNC